MLDQLENNDAVLLMYLADELPAEDRAEVERMLSVDAGLRAELERLRAASAWVAEQINREDRSTRLPASQAAAVRRVGRSMRQWHARHLAEAPARPAAPVQGLRYPWWAYPLAAAASVVIAFLVWWGNVDRDPTVVQRDTGQYTAPYPISPDRALAMADPVMLANFRAEMVARSLGLDYGPEGYGSRGFAGPELAQVDWDESSAVYAAVAPTDANVLMLQGDETEAGTDDEAVN